VLTPSLPYEHTNAVAMRPDDLTDVVSSLADSLADAYPQSGQLWASGVGGWLTFAACCANTPEFFKRWLLLGACVSLGSGVLRGSGISHCIASVGLWCTGTACHSPER